MNGALVSVPEAVRQTGVRGDVIFLAIRHGEIQSVPDERGIDRVDPDEVRRLQTA
ncbi:MAG: hypothetical protein KDB10_22310 [Acidimicrobiales bacterium]|nr:hypothetical protein [Acidimicrobiales bacterium]